MSNCIAICKAEAPGVEQENGFVFLNAPLKPPELHLQNE